MLKRGVALFIGVAVLLLIFGNIAFAGDNKKLTVLAIVYVKPGFEDKAEKEMMKLVPLTHQEPGCINYDMHVSVGVTPDDYGKKNRNLYMFYENWRSREDWDLHMQMPYLQRWINEIAPKVTEKIDLTIWEMVSQPTNPTFRGGSNPDPIEKYTLLALVDVKPKNGCLADKIPDCIDRARKEMMSLVPLTHIEPGCINYEMHTNLDVDTMAPNPRRVMFYENWYDFDVWYYDHMNADYLVRWFDMAPKLTDKIELTGWKMIDFKEKPVK
jgi:quinol monooxygenase YgiN